MGDVRMKRYNANSGWFSESRRHSLASKGVKTGRKVDYGIVSKYNLESSIPEHSHSVSVTNKKSANIEDWGEVQDKLHTTIDKIEKKNPEVAKKLRKDVHKITTKEKLKQWIEDNKAILVVSGYLGAIMVTVGSIPFISPTLAGYVPVAVMAEGVAITAPFMYKDIKEKMKERRLK
jgi:hypothetical protein